METPESIDTSSFPNSTEDDHSVDQTSIELSTFTSAIIMSIFCLFGVYSNIMSAVIFLHPIMRSPINILLGTLSIIDLCLVCLVVPVFILPAFNIFIESPDLRSLYPITLMFIYPLNMFAQTCSVWTFVLVSLERFSAVCRPLKSRHKLLTCNQAILAESSIVLLAFSYNAIRFWEYEFSSNSRTGFQRLLRKNHFYYVFYSTVLYVLTHCFVPFLIILTLNACILRSLRRSHLRWQEMSRKQIQQRKTSAMIVVVTLMFLFCNFTPFLINIWEALEIDLFYGARMELAYVLLDVSNLLIVLNSSSTALIYWIYCRKYRLLFKHFVTLECFRDGHKRRISNLVADHFGKALLQAHFPAAVPLLINNSPSNKRSSVSSVGRKSGHDIRTDSGCGFFL